MKGRRHFIAACFCTLALAQNSRDEYRSAYRAWREADPNLERAAGATITEPPVAQRADRLSGQMARYAAARKAFIAGQLKEGERQVAWLETPHGSADEAVLNAKSESGIVAAEAAVVTRVNDALAGDPDKGIQQLRAALGREKAALDAVKDSIAQLQRTADALTASGDVAEHLRARAVEQSRAMIDGWKESAEEVSREEGAWAEYYRKLGESATGPLAITVSELHPDETKPPERPPVSLSPAPLPLSRYTGAWTYSAASGSFKGPQPEFVDVLVHEENGRVTGTLIARFKLPSESKDDPVLRFDFKGEMQNTRSQLFALTTSDGVKGRIELTPGDAVNLLEINFETDAKAGKIHASDVVLVKK